MKKQQHRLTSNNLINFSTYQIDIEKIQPTPAEAALLIELIVGLQRKLIRLSTHKQSRIYTEMKYFIKITKLWRKQVKTFCCVRKNQSKRKKNKSKLLCTLTHSPSEMYNLIKCFDYTFNWNHKWHEKNDNKSSSLKNSSIDSRLSIASDVTNSVCVCLFSSSHFILPCIFARLYLEKQNKTIDYHRLIAIHKYIY